MNKLPQQVTIAIDEKTNIKLTKHQSFTGPMDRPGHYKIDDELYPTTYDAVNELYTCQEPTTPIVNHTPHKIKIMGYNLGPAQGVMVHSRPLYGSAEVEYDVTYHESQITFSICKRRGEPLVIDYPGA